MQWESGVLNEVQEINCYMLHFTIKKIQKHDVFAENMAVKMLISYSSRNYNTDTKFVQKEKRRETICMI